VNAYEKDPVTGIVKHLDDQCIGCQYCMLKCPYDVPRYNADRGIVRKCDMCSSRLQAGEAPACVQACPTEAIRIVTVAAERVVDDCQTAALVPGAPDSSYTLPTTRYQRRDTVPANTLPADFHLARPEHPHWPLVIMLVLSQLSVGAFAADFALTRLGAHAGLDVLHPLRSAVAFVVGVLALGSAVLHLGRPTRAWRAFIGVGRSWLSREIIVFGVFAKLAILYASLPWWEGWASRLGLTLPAMVAAPEFAALLGAP
jgi:ferredoxin